MASEEGVLALSQKASAPWRSCLSAGISRAAKSQTLPGKPQLALGQRQRARILARTPGVTGRIIAPETDMVELEVLPGLQALLLEVEV